MTDIVDNLMDDIFQTPTQNEPSTTHVIYETPLNDALRISLRLEHLHKTIQGHIHKSTTSDAYIALSAILQITNVTDRPDIKSRLTQCLMQASQRLSQLTNQPQINTKALQDILLDIETNLSHLTASHSRITNHLRENEFLNAVRLNLGTPGGLFPFNLPALDLWLHSAPSKRNRNLSTWYEECKPILSIANLILQLNRDASVFTKVFSRDGFYQQNLNPLHPIDLIRVKLPTEINVYPEFSAGKHRLSIRLLQPYFVGSGKPQQFRDPIEFELACCRI